MNALPIGFGTLVVLAIISGAVPVGIVEEICPPKSALPDWKS